MSLKQKLLSQIRAKNDVSATKRSNSEPGTKIEANSGIAENKAPFSDDEPKRINSASEGINSSVRAPTELNPPSGHLNIPAAGVDVGEQDRSRLSTSLPIPDRLMRTLDGIRFGKLVTRAPAPYRPLRDSEGKLRPGHTANPLGRPPSLARYVYDLTGGGQEMIDHAVTVMRGSSPIRWLNDDGDTLERDAPASIKDQADARTFLQTTMQPELDKVAAANQGEHLDFDKLTHEEVVVFRQLLSKAKAGLGSLSRVSAEGETDAELVDSPSVPPATPPTA